MCVTSCACVCCVNWLLSFVSLGKFFYEDYWEEGRKEFINRGTPRVFIMVLARLTMVF